MDLEFQNSAVSSGFSLSNIVEYFQLSVLFQCPSVLQKINRLWGLLGNDFFEEKKKVIFFFFLFQVDWRVESFHIFVFKLWDVVCGNVCYIHLFAVYYQRKSKKKFFKIRKDDNVFFFLGRICNVFFYIQINIRSDVRLLYIIFLLNVSGTRFNLFEISFLFDRKCVWN